MYASVSDDSKLKTNTRNYMIMFTFFSLMKYEKKNLMEQQKLSKFQIHSTNFHQDFSSTW